LIAFVSYFVAVDNYLNDNLDNVLSHQKKGPKNMLSKENVMKNYIIIREKSYVIIIIINKSYVNLLVEHV